MGVREFKHGVDNGADGKVITDDSQKPYSATVFIFLKSLKVEGTSVMTFDRD